MATPAEDETILLLGWMERDLALSYLCKDCVASPPYAESEAESLWMEYRALVSALPERAAKSPKMLKLSSAEKRAAQQFLAPYRTAGETHIQDVIKVDPMGLVIHQLFMTVETTRQFMDGASTESWGIRNCLAERPKEGRSLHGNFRRNSAEIQIPHREFAVDFQAGNRFEIVEYAGHVSASKYGDRTLLWAGYHRAYARAVNLKADGLEQSLLVVLSRDADYLLAPDSPEPELRDKLLGARPPIFADFFDDRLTLKVKLRRKRFELRIRASVETVAGNE